MSESKNTADYIRQSLTALNLIEQPITYQDYINNKETTTEAVDKSALRAWYDKYSKYEGNNADELPAGMLKAYIDTGILTDGVEINEFQKAVEAIGGDRDEVEQELFANPEKFAKMLPITHAMQEDFKKIMSVSEIDEDNCREAAKILGDDVVGFGIAEDIINEMGDEETELLSGVRDEDNILIVQRGYNADDIDEDPRVIGELYASEKYSDDDIKKAIADYLKSKNLDTNFYYDSTPNDYYEKTVDGRPFRAEVSLHWLGDMGESVEEDDDEYDQPASRPEAEMVDNQIAFIKYAVDEIEDNVKAGGEFPEWFQNKLSGVHETIKMLHAYMEGERRSDDQGEEQMGEKAPPGREKQVKKLKKKFDDPGAPYAIAWAQHNKHGKPSKESIGESTMTDTNKEKLNEGIRIQTDSLEDSIALMTIMKNAGLDPQQMNIQQSPSMNAPAPDMTPDLPAEIPGQEPEDMPMDEPESEAFDNAPDEKFLDKDDYELKRNKVPNTKMGPASAKQGDNPLEAIEEIAKQLNREYELFKEGRQKDEREDMEADASDMSKAEFIKAHDEAKAYIWDRVQAREKGQTNEGRVKDMVLDMESDAAEMSKEEFIKAHGEQYAHIWDRVQGQMSGDPQYDEGHANEDRASDSVVMAKLKQAVGGEEKLVLTLLSSAVQNNMDDDEFIDAASRMLNMPPQEIQAIIDNDMNPQQEEDSELEDILRLSGTGKTMEAKKSKPDYLDFDKDGDKKEPMKKALADKKKK